MKTLAIDTSHAAGSVVACQAPPVRGATPPAGALAVRSLGPAGEHAGRLAAALAEAAAELGWTIADAEAVVVVRGPGSFTGLRVGVATAKAVAWAGGGRLVGVSGFEIVARLTADSAADAGSRIELGYDAGRGEVYAATAAADPLAAGGWRIGPARLVTAEDWIATLPPGSLVSGPVLATLAERLAAAGHRPAPTAAWHPSAAAAAMLGLARLAAGATDDPAALVPEYLRPSYADERAR
jgi:tRNA threonylcarbamoyladenosine biosynthesis protein TsaB